MSSNKQIELEIKVADGNPGALRIVHNLRYFKLCYDIMNYLIEKEIIGEILYLRVNSSKFRGSSLAFGEYILSTIQKGQHLNYNLSTKHLNNISLFI